MQERRGSDPRSFLGAIAATLVGVFVIGAATRLVPVSPVARLGIIGLVVATLIGFAATRKRWDVVIAVGLTVFALAGIFIWLASSVVGDID